MKIITVVLVLLCGACGSTTSSKSISTIALSPSPCGVAKTGSTKMSAEATLPDGTKQDVTTASGGTWTSGNSNTATVNPEGIVVGVSIGITSITLAYKDATGTVNCTVGP